MTATLLTALIIQMMTIALLRHHLGRYWLRHPTTLIVLSAALYQGVSPLLLTIPSVSAINTFRNGVQQSFVDSATLMMSAGMLTFTVAYLLTRPQQLNTAIEPAVMRKMIRVLDWKLLAFACIPLMILTYEGRGYNSGVPLEGSATSIGSHLAATFFVTLIVITAFSFLVRQGVRWFIPVLSAQSLVLAAAGERTPVVADAFTLILMLSIAGYRPSSRQLREASALTIIAVLAITGLRVEQGRSVFYTNSGLNTRVTALGGGLTEFTGTPGQGLAPADLIGQAAVRLDGTDFSGAILQSVSFGQRRLSPVFVLKSLLIVIPSAMWSSKLANESILNPPLLEINDFGLQQINFLPTFPGLFTGFLTAPWLVSFLALTGLLCGWGERWLFRRRTPARVVLITGAITAVLISYGSGLPAMLVDLRTAAAIAGCAKLIHYFARRVSPTRSPAAGAPAVPRRSVALDLNATQSGSAMDLRPGTLRARSSDGPSPY